MNSILATEPAPVAPEEKKTTPLPPLETRDGNEPMRHVPAASWMARKVETDIRKRVDLLSAVFATVPNNDPRHAAVDAEQKPLCKALERLADAAKPGVRHNNGHHDLRSRIESLLTQSAAALHGLESTAFGRRNPYHAWDRSNAEPVYAAFLAVISHVERCLTLARAIDPGIDERLLEGLVVLQNPVDDRMLRPIA
jgi:hypothetical protein